MENDKTQESLPVETRQDPAQETLPATKQESTSYLAEYQNIKGYHNGFTSEDVKIPRVTLMQALSDMVEAEEAKAGEFINNVTLENYGTELEFILLALTDREIIKGRSYFVDKKLHCQSIDRITGKGDPGGECNLCEYSEWGPNGEAPECPENYTYLIYVLGTDDDLPAGLVLGKTSMKTAKSFNLLIKGMLNSIYKGKKQPFTTVFKLFSEKEKNNKGSYYIYKIKKARFAKDEELAGARELYEGFSGTSFTVEMGGEEGEIADTGTAVKEEPF